MESNGKCKRNVNISIYLELFALSVRDVCSVHCRMCNCAQADPSSSTCISLVINSTGVCVDTLMHMFAIQLAAAAEINLFHY